MKIFFHIFLYLNVGIGSLFFVIWLLTSFPFFSVVAEEPSLDTISSKSLSGDPTAAKGPEEVFSSIPTLRNKDLPVKQQQPVQGMEALKERNPASSVSNNISQENKENSVPLAPSMESPSLDPAATDSSVVDPPSVVPDLSVVPDPNDTLSDGENFVPPPPLSTDSDDAKDVLLDSVKKIQKDGVHLESVNELININKKVAEIYKMLSGYNYDPSGTRDPFTPFKEDEEELQKQTPDESHLVPLNYPTAQYDLDDLKLVGIKWASKIGPSKALFSSPDNMIYHLQKNDRIGNNRGIVYQLREDEVVILEPRFEMTETEQAGKYVYTPIIVRLDRWKGNETAMKTDHFNKKKNINNNSDMENNNTDTNTPDTVAPSGTKESI